MRLYVLAAVAVFVVVCADVACHGVPLTSPTGSTISVRVDKNTLPLNGQATVNAVVIESAGTPVQNGTTVTFTSTLGSFQPAESKTVNGVATAIFNAGSISGTTNIHAYSGGTSTGSGNSSSGGVEVRIGAAAAGSIAVSASPPSISQSGGTVTISALVSDASNNPLPGVSVLFSANSGTLSSTSALSDGAGVAKVTLTTSQTTTVIATANSGARGEVQVVVSTAPIVTIDVSPASPVAGTPVAITIAPQGGGSGNASPRQISTVVVDFGDGSSQTLTNITGSSGLTHTYQRAGGYTISARATDVTGNTGLSSKAIVVQPVIVGATVSATPQSGNAPFNGVITVGATSAAGAPPVQSVRAFINGEQVFSGSSGGTFAYRFASPGTYTINVIVTDTAGNEGRASTIVIAN